LQQASLVFETVVEGGITRFMAVYIGQNPPTIGPLRSTRLYFNSWAAGLGAILVHDGGNVDALQELPSLKSVGNVDADHVFSPFWRSSSRLAPDNEYTSSNRLSSYFRQEGITTSARSVTIPTVGDVLSPVRPAPFVVHIQFSYGDYNVDWRYDPAANDFIRSASGPPSIDATTKRQLTARTVIVMQVQETPGNDPFTLFAVNLKTEGSGPAMIYQDGIAVSARWSKPSVESPLQWLDRNNRPIALDGGTTWVEAVPVGNTVSVTRLPAR
jgi:hypothetical protein